MIVTAAAGTAASPAGGLAGALEVGHLVGHLLSPDPPVLAGSHCYKICPTGLGNYRAARR